ncbi:AAEL012543-PA [Aedes aegypti]|uniref:AAEL012543-PA n=2 Tax=Aedes aegypti TaxID=7159 RepID=A0A1S4FWW8_AEDAE|nr:restin homolog [Aedes aegypti]EAT35278.1 AAEL012543-PA [Aedes aegypti]
MTSQISCTSAQKNALDVVESLIRTVPEKSAARTSGDEAWRQQPSNSGAEVPKPRQSRVMDNRRIMKMKQQVAKQNNFITELKKKIRLLSSMPSKSITDHEELAFLKSRLDKENQLLKGLIDRLIREQKTADSPGWEQIRLCTDPLEDICRNPWMLGNFSMPDQRFSFDSTLSSLSSKAQVDGESVEQFCDLDDRVKKELMNRDRVIEILQARVEALTADVMKVKRDNFAILDKNPKQTKFCEADMVNRLKFYKENTDALEKNLKQMDAALEVIRMELGPALTGEVQESIGCNTYAASNELNKTTEDIRRSSSASKQGDDQYKILMKEYAKKNDECKKLTDRLAKSCSCRNDTPEQLEEDVLKKRCSELLDIQEEFQILIKEQGDQLEEYRSKYLSAQQRVEEQKLEMEKMNVTNRRIEEQINVEVQRIKTKFQDKLRQLTPFPRLLEAEEEKVSKLKDSNEKLLEELKKSAKEIKSLEDRLHNAHASQNAELEKAHNLLQVELEQLQGTLQVEKDKKAKLQAQLEEAQQELDDTRTETAKIIARTNDRAQEDRRTAQARIHSLEVELTQSRAAASVTINNREEALREMQGQIRVLSGSLNDAQIQIQSLRNQLTFLQNERYGSHF